MNEELLIELKNKYPIGTIIEGIVEYHAAFGVFVNIDHNKAKGLVQIVDFLDSGIMSEDQYPKIGGKIEGVVLGYTEDERNQIWMSVKPSKLREAKCQTNTNLK